ncbi:MAG: flagellar biosynthetic protein FliR [Planctomycetes bacterium]|nr:flagellar biosynthetic protein FliR [Planctomycetota bacterium]
MSYEFLAQYLKLPVFALVLSRLGGLIMFQPILGTMAVPMNLRVLLVAGLAMLVTPFVDLPGGLPDTPGGIALAMASELLLGALIGLVMALCFVGLQMGGTLIAQESGLAFGQIADPSTGDQQTVLASLYVQLAGAIYLIVGGHRALLGACLDTFYSIPLLEVGGQMELCVTLLVEVLTVGGQVAVRVAAPAVVTLFMVNIALGFISRTVPQLNITTVGFSIKGLISFLIIAISLPSAVAAFTDALACAIGWLGELAGS